MIFALIIIDVCFLLAHLCEGIDWMFYPLVMIATVMFDLRNLMCVR